MNGMPEHCYFIRHVPIDLLVYKDEETEEWEELGWFRALREDIRENGLTCPILVNMVPGPYNRFGAWGVTAGHHRIGACKSIGWEYIPCLVYGAAVPLSMEPYHVPNLTDVHDVLRDGKVRLEHEMFWMNEATIPETFKYPETSEPYWPTSPD